MAAMIVSTLSLLLLVVTATAVRAEGRVEDVHADFDCKMRQLAVEFAQHLQPFRSAAAWSEIADALNGAKEKTPANCTVSSSLPGSAHLPPAVSHIPLFSPRSLARFVQDSTIVEPQAGGITVFADPVHGSDTSGTGSQASPFQSIARALAATRQHKISSSSSSDGGSTIVLREGVFFDTPTQVLTAQDSGLTIQAFPGEEAWVSGGVQLMGLKWNPYNVSKTDPQWTVSQGVNAVYEDVSPPNVVLAGKTSSWSDCQALCVANHTAGGPCTVWTWHDQNQGMYALHCYIRTDNRWSAHEEVGHVSGRLTQGNENTWVASLAGMGIDKIPGLRYNNARLVRARYPNANPETDGFLPPAVFRATWTPQQAPRAPQIQIDLPASMLDRNNTVSMFQTFTAGIGGTCDRFQPNAGYWCSAHVQGGGSQIYFVPVAMQADKSVLPHLPYADPRGAIIQTWRPGHWASWMYEVTSVEESTTPAESVNFSLYGGFQGSRGDDSGEDTYIENVFEELDVPGEYFYNETTQELFLFFNASAGTPPPADGLVVTRTKHLFNITGTMANPVQNISFSGIGLRDTAYTYMDPHGIPSGGDWTLERSAVVFLEGTEGVNISGCVFERIDGNAILLSAYNRNASITKNEFVWIGATAIALWGNTDGGDARLPPGYGYDGSAGNQPRHNTIALNLCHELGIWEKQSSFYTQFKSSENTIYGNIVYNGPRAHINFNDGFRGGAKLVHNLIFNSCRESGDHGPFNSWDRDPYLADFPGTGQLTTTKAMDEIAYNFILANYNTLGAVDNDDGSASYNTHDNFFVYGSGGLKNDFEGHDNWWTNNVVVLSASRPALHNGYGGTVGEPGRSPYVLNGHEQKLVGNHILILANNVISPWTYALPICSGTGKTVMGNNSLFLADATQVSICSMPLDKWQSQGNDPGTVAKAFSPTQADDTLALARSTIWNGP